jgi:membrane associated rhomboid family serine protease
MLPLKDNNPTETLPFITVSIIILNIAVYIYQLSLGHDYERFIFSMGAIPNKIINNSDVIPMISLSAFLTIYSSMFLHGSLLHLISNMLYLWIFGNNIEDAMGHIRFIFFYLISGSMAAFAHILTDIDSRIPMIGASGAVSGVLGAYILLYPRAKVLTLVMIGFFVRLVRIPAIYLLGFWILIQFLFGMTSLTVRDSSGGVAWFAHIGGFITGFILINIFKLKRRVRRRIF